MRIIAGRFKGRRLYEVAGGNTRSTKDRVKETLFNMIGPYSVYERVLDLFAGSGALGLEALSRFSKQGEFVERNDEAFDVLKQNIYQFNLKNTVKAHFIDAEVFIETTSKSFDLIFLDPPYQQKEINTWIKKIEEANLLSKDGLMITLIHYEEELNLSNAWQITKERVVGITKIVFIERSN